VQPTIIIHNIIYKIIKNQQKLEINIL
jgi:hypothetical protein